MSTKHPKDLDKVHPKVKAAAQGGALLSGLSGLLAALGTVDWKAFALALLTGAASAGLGYLKRS